MPGTRKKLTPPAHWAETLVQSLPDGVILCDGAGQITFFSRGAEQITGCSSSKALGQPFGTVLHLSDRDQAKIMEYLAGLGSPRQMRVNMRGERPAALAVTGARLAQPDGGEQFALVLRDVTDEETGRHLHSYFLANISHEFRTPLSGLNASIELLLDEAGHLSPAEMDELLNSIHLSASGLQALVDNLLESANIEAGHFVIHRRPTDLNQVIAEAIRIMQPLLDRRKQALALTEPLQLPPVIADPNRLTQVLINLLSNASKYSPLEQTIEVGVAQIDHGLRITVADRGPGIPPAEQAAIFRRFVRLGAEDAEQYGIGLGLSVVKAIVEGHGGDIGVDERPGGGSIFWFTLSLEGEPIP